MSNNGSLGGSVRDTDFAVFDAMPAEIRRAFAEAPYDLAFGDVAGQLMAFRETLGRSLNAAELGFAVAAIRDEYSFELEVIAYALYGAEHPQARPVSRDCLIDLNLLSTFASEKRWREGKDAPPTAAARKSQRIGRRSRDLYAPVRVLRRCAGATKHGGHANRINARVDTSRASFDPRRDALPVHANAAAALMGDPPIGRRAIDRKAR